jgi:hypothetical protein
VSPFVFEPLFKLDPLLMEPGVVVPLLILLKNPLFLVPAAT